MLAAPFPHPWRSLSRAIRVTAHYKRAAAGGSLLIGMDLARRYQRQGGCSAQVELVVLDDRARPAGDHAKLLDRQSHVCFATPRCGANPRSPERRGATNFSFR
jgi:hypothetical protein